ncbi:unnamed protein product [Pleuronectes platessa]|uniref:Uncharacterized protein n=1 Tax=Pleuronectes platessa TaxID=8262 RepID=A0A9N7TXB9_PLEPL|nr:unnamed protein product [Pleuronectes platessa]
MEPGPGWDLQSEPQTPEQLCACTPHCQGPVDAFLHWSSEYLMSLAEDVDQKHLSSATLHRTSNSPVVVFQHNEGKKLSRICPLLLITTLGFTLPSRSTPLSSSPPPPLLQQTGRRSASGQSPAAPAGSCCQQATRRSLNTEGNAVARRGQEESLNPELTNSKVGGDVTVTVQDSS